MGFASWDQFSEAVEVGGGLHGTGWHGFCNTVSPLHMKLQVVNFWWECAFCQGQVWLKLQLALHLLLLMTLQSSTISYRPFLLQPVTLLACSLDASSCVPAVVVYHCTFLGTILQDWKSFFIFCINWRLITENLFVHLFVFDISFMRKVL